MPVNYRDTAMTALLDTTHNNWVLDNTDNWVS